MLIHTKKKMSGYIGVKIKIVDKISRKVRKGIKYNPSMVLK